jgi:hypothetical protein
MLTALLVILAQNQEPNAEAWIRPPRVERVQRAGGRSGPSLAFFEAFPQSGAGTTGVCSTTAPTGAKGEALTFTRASNGTCTKTATGGLATTGIANGDLVVLSSNVARQMYDANGVLGLLVEASRTNALLRSQELDNAAWSTIGTLPTITANFATAPDGTLTAERVQFAATAGAGFSLVEQSLAAAASPHIGGCYVKGNGTSGTIDIASRSVGTCIADCPYVAGSWTRCLTPSCANANTIFDVGNYSLANGGVARGAADVFVWGCGREDGAYATSYTPTVASTVTRSADSAGQFSAAAMGPSGCIAASVTWPSASVGAVNIAAFGTAGAGNNWTLYRTNNTAAGYQIGATITAPAVAAMNLTTHRAVLSDAAGTRSAWWDTGSVAAPAASLGGTQTLVWVGAGVSGGTPSDGIVSRFQIDPVASRCSL